jgi:mevalonate kinase
MTTASAPGKVILFGEHAVVYDKLGIATTLDKRCFITVSQGKEGVFIDSPGLGIKSTLSKEGLFDLLDDFEDLKQKKDYEGIKKIPGQKLAPIFLMTAKVMKKIGFEDINITYRNEIPKNMGASSAIYASTALAVSDFLGKKLSLQEISDFAFDGDVIAHGGTPSGIDNNTVTYGKYLSYRKSKGFDFLDVDFKIPLIIVESGEPSQTNKTVPMIREMKKEFPETVNPALEKLDEISIRGLEMLKKQDLESLGKLMTEYYNELKKLGISTEKLDEIVKIALNNDALGAKPTGGWGGGSCIVLTDKPNDLIRIFKQNNYIAYQTKLGVEGVRIET